MNLWICCLHKSYLRFLPPYLFLCSLPHGSNWILVMLLPLIFLTVKTESEDASGFFFFFFCLFSAKCVCFSAVHFIFPSAWFAWSLILTCHKRKYSIMYEKTHVVKPDYFIMFSSVCFDEKVVRVFRTLVCWRLTFVHLPLMCMRMICKCICI